MKAVQINYERCIGCKHCEIACAIEHSSSKEILKCIYEEPSPKRRISVEISEEGIPFPVNCRHCEIALCMNVCPMSAIRKEDGIVSIDQEFCIGCGMCGLACPFGMISFSVFPKIKAIKCDGCMERIKKGKVPACVEACKTGALVYEEFDEYEKKKRERLVFSISGKLEQKVPEGILIWKDYLRQIR